MNDSIETYDLSADKILNLSKEFVKLIVFKIGNQKFAFNIDAIVEISALNKITRVPNSSKIISGLVNLRGKIVLVLNINEVLGLNLNITSLSRLILFELNNDILSIVVDEIVQIMTVNKKNIQKISNFREDKINEEFIKGVVILNNNLITILDENKLLSEETLFEIMNKISLE